MSFSILEGNCLDLILFIEEKVDLTFDIKKYYKDYIYTERLNEIWDTQYKNLEYTEKQEVMDLN